jgi:predicted RNA-binding Zn-ribbon protein involved in translation (DUF1610 family)
MALRYQCFRCDMLTAERGADGKCPGCGSVQSIRDYGCRNLEKDIEEVALHAAHLEASQHAYGDAPALWSVLESLRLAQGQAKVWREQAEHFGRNLMASNMELVDLRKALGELGPVGCICPPTSEKTCQGLGCPRRALPIGPA